MKHLFLFFFIATAKANFQINLLQNSFLPQLIISYQNNSILIQTKGNINSLNLTTDNFSVAKLNAFINAKAEYKNNAISGQFDIKFAGGELVWDALYLNFDSIPTTIKSHFYNKDKLLKLTDFEINDGINYAAGDLEINKKLTYLSIKELSGESFLLFEKYAKPFLQETAFSNTKFNGSIYLRGLWDGKLREFAAVFNKLDVEDERFFIKDLDGQLGNDGTKSRLKISSAGWHKIPFGASELSFNWSGQQFELLKLFRLPIADGALLIEALDTEKHRLSASLEPISLAALIDKRFTGKISGNFPNISVDLDTISLREKIFFEIFDGRIEVSSLVLKGILSNNPILQFNLNARDLELQKITEIIDIGKISGLLDVDAQNVRFVNWVLTAFDMDLRADHGKRRINHEAVAYLTRAGGANVLMAQMVRLIKVFPYEKIAIQGVLKNGVLNLTSEDTKNGGFYLLKGSALPRIDVIAYEKRVDWKDLLARLNAASSSDKAVIK